MPEAAMNKNYLESAREHKIRLTRQVTAMEPIAVAQSVDDASRADFRLGVLRPHAAHHPTSFSRAYLVHAVGKIIAPGKLLKGNLKERFWEVNRAVGRSLGSVVIFM